MHNYLMLLVFLLLPFLNGIMYRLGGDGSIPFLFIPGFRAHFWRSLGIGTLSGVSWALLLHSWVPLLCVGTYFIPGAFPYGTSSWLNFLGTKNKWLVSGFAFGICTFPIIGWWSILQGIVSAIAYLVLKIIDDKEVIETKWIERARGYFGTICI